ncbi:GNAT family N-acetyltransferase [Secundilactobacillus yichangensis]|uniref:GNAT family N-acetyltransferase n=1 Tax=Secundilactobacillus yichangensis TaxID=2799580 RepID=UPI00194199A7|nr:GNAT family N-acetyltransferase [Secundilactobacillus yichangensis]
MTQIGIIAGSLRKNAYSKKVANELANLLPFQLNPIFIDIGQLPLYNADLDADNLVPAWETFRHQLDDVAGLIIVTPEYNRGTTAALKNAFDVGSKRHNHWKYKTALVVSSSPEATGGFGANQQVRQALVTLNVTPVQRPEVYLGNISHLFNGQDLITDPAAITLLQTAINAFVKLQARFEIESVESSPLIRYEPGHFYIDGQDGNLLAEIIFHNQQNKRIVITNTRVNERIRSQGIANQLTLRVIRFAQIHELTIIPDCTYAQYFVKKHPEYQQLFTE